MYSFMNSGSGRRTVSTVCVVRKPSCTLKKGVCVASAARRQIRQKSPASWALRANSMPQPQSATRHHVVVAGVDVESLAGQGAGADVHDHRQALAGDRVQHLLHQHQALAGGEVGDPAAGDGEALADGGRRVLAFRLEEHQRIAPEVLVAVHHGRVEAAAHRGRAGDRVGPGRLGDVDLDVDDGLGAVAGGGNARDTRTWCRWVREGCRGCCVLVRTLRRCSCHALSLAGRSVPGHCSKNWQIVREESLSGGPPHR